jgi:small conductance mechanosensitive channel
MTLVQTGNIDATAVADAASAGPSASFGPDEPGAEHRGWHDVSMILAITSLGDFRHWVRGDGLEIVLLIVGSVLLARFAAWFGNWLTTRIDDQDVSDDALVRSEAAKHRHSLTQVITWTVVVLIYSVTGVLVVARFGVPLTSLIAPATVAGVALGFGAQRIVQDLLAGFFIITERQYGFGDLIRISNLGSTTGVTGTVEDVTLRTTRMRTVNGEVVIIPNGQINQVTNLSRDWARAVVDIPLPATADINRVNEILQKVGEDVYADESLRPLLLDTPTVMGVESIDVGTLSTRMVSRTLPGKQFVVGRELRARVATALREAGITLAADLETSTAPRSS